MKGFEERHPLAVFFWFLAVILIPVFAFHPLVLLLSLGGGTAFFSLVGGEGKKKIHGAMLLLVFLFTCLNPVFNHSGETLLFFVNDRAVTGEALFYGFLSGVALAGMLYWFLAFSRWMRVDQWFCVLRFGGEKFALLFTMVMRFVPLLSRRLKLIRQAQRGLGLYTEDNLFSRLRSEARVFSALATWALENGIITADSMEARGYGAGKRSSFTPQTFTKKDILFLLLVLASLASALTVIACGGFVFSCFPTVEFAPLNFWELFGYFSYALLAFLPVILCVMEEVKWNFLHRKI